MFPPPGMPTTIMFARATKNKTQPNEGGYFEGTSGRSRCPSEKFEVLGPDHLGEKGAYP